MRVQSERNHSERTQIFVLLNIEPKVERVFGSFPLQEQVETIQIHGGSSVCMHSPSQIWSVHAVAVAAACESVFCWTRRARTFRLTKLTAPQYFSQRWQSVACYRRCATRHPVMIDRGHRFS